MNASTPGRGREIDGVYFPSVTEVLDAVGLGVNLNGVPAEVRNAAMARGKAVHTVVEWILTGIPFDPATMAASIRPYVQAAEAFLTESGFEPVAVEAELTHPAWKYCFPVGTLVMAENGAIPIERLSLSDRLYDREGRLRVIQRLASRPYSGMVIEITPRKMIPFSCTPDHEILTAQVKTSSHPMRRSIEGFIWKRAEEIRPGDWLVTPKLQHDTPESVESPPLAYLYGRFVGDGSTMLSREGTSQRGHSRITFGLHEWADLENLREIVTRYGEVRIIKGARTFNLQFGRTRVAREFRARFGSGAMTKRIPPDIMGASPKIIKEFFRGYYDADGWRHKGTYEASTASVGLALQLQLLATRLGVLPTIFHRKEAGPMVILGRATTRLDRWLIRVGGTDSPRLFAGADPIHRRAFHIEGKACFAVPVLRVDHRTHNGPVYDIQTGGSFLVNNMVVHNCGHPDWIGYCRKWPGAPLVLADLKTGQADIATATYQLAAYGLLWAAQPGAPALRKTMILEAHGDGSYRVLPVDVKGAEQVFLASLVVYRARRELRGAR